MYANHAPATIPSPAWISRHRSASGALRPARILCALLSAVLLALLAAVPEARAASVLTGEHKTLDGSQPAFTYTVTLDDQKVRMETSSSPGSAFIYRADKGLFWILDSDRKTYSEMTLKDLESMAASMDAAMKSMLEQLAQLPPEQRSAMEKMMKENMGYSGDGKATYKKTGTGKVGTWSCEKFDCLVDGKKKAEICSVEPDALGLSDADYRSLMNMSKPFEKLAKDLRFMLPQDGASGAPKGPPAKAVVFEGGKPHSEAVIKSVKQGGVDASRFEVPKGYAKKAISAADLGK